jgi:hypothetical protein
LWYVRSIDETSVLHDEKNAVWRTRDVMIFTDFKPNAEVDPKLFSEDALRLNAGSPIIDRRTGTNKPTVGVRGAQ